MRMAGPFSTKLKKNIYLNPMQVESVGPVNSDGTGDGTVVLLAGVQESFFEVNESIGHVVKSLNEAMS